MWDATEVGSCYKVMRGERGCVVSIIVSVVVN